MIMLYSLLGTQRLVRISQSFQLCLVGVCYEILLLTPMHQLTVRLASYVFGEVASCQFCYVSWIVLAQFRGGSISQLVELIRCLMLCQLTCAATDLALQGMHHTLAQLCLILTWFDVVQHGSAGIQCGALLASTTWSSCFPTGVHMHDDKLLDDCLA